MQNKYVGDIGDFGKFGLLRAFTRVGSSGRSLKLGVVWYLAPDDSRGRDGQHIGYLVNNSTDSLRACDDGLFVVLRDIVKTRRHVEEIRNRGLLPGAIFFEKQIPGSSSARESWIAEAAATVRACDVVFADPDVGISTGSGDKSGMRKYALIPELRQLVGDQKSLIVYQHLNRDGDAVEQAKRRAAQLSGEFGVRQITCLWWRRVSGRLYFIVPQGRDRELVQSRTKEFAAGAWKAHFSEIPVA